VAYHMHVLLDDEVYLFELQKWVSKLGEYLEKVAKKVQGKKELAQVYKTLPQGRGK